MKASTRAKILTVVGARPQFIKAAAVSQALATRPVEEIVIHTGQHYDDSLSAIFFAELELREPDVNLAVGSSSHGAQTAAMLVGLERELLDRKPDLVLTYGDTNSTLAAALAAAKAGVPVAHVEAGLRSHNRRMPEEINRLVADALGDLLLAPTTTAVENLRREGISPERIRHVGDVMYDVALRYGRRAETASRILDRLGLRPGAYVLATVHRAENTDDADRLRAVLQGLGAVARQLAVVLPLHPRTRTVIAGAPGLGQLLAPLQILEPVGYLDMIQLQKNAAVIATDSGGIQKEAFFYEVPCVTLRDETEWVELVELGWNQLCPPHRGDQVREAILAAVGRRGRAARPYGDGAAAVRVVDALLEVVQRRRA